MGIINLIISIVILYDIITFLSGLISYKSDSSKDLGEVLFKERIKYYKKIIHFVGLSLFLILSSETLYEYPLVSIIVFLFIGVFWLYSYFSKRLIVTVNGVGYMDIFNSVLDFVDWDDIEFIYLEKTKMIAYLKSKQKKKYYIDLTNEELNKVQKYLPESIKRYVYRAL